MKKKILGILLIVCVIFSYGLAGAITVEEADIPKQLRSAVPGNYALWFPAVPSMPQEYGWESYIILANWSNADINISAWATAASGEDANSPTLKIFGLGPYEKKILTLANWGFMIGTIADIWLTSDAGIFGATVLLMDVNTSKVLTAIPHIDIQW